MKVNPVAKKLAPFPEAKHDENAWAARSPIPFQFLFGSCRHSENSQLL